MDISLTLFSELDLAAPILQALSAEGYSAPTPIQAQAIPHVLAGRDLLGIAQTGTGKTAAFALPILHRLAAQKRRPEPKTCRALILSPTRELASQIAESFRTYGRNLGLSVAVVYGGVSERPQAERLGRGVDILVATPGRLIDHLDQRNLRLDKVEAFVLDEADQMLDMGFIHAIRRLVPKLAPVRQSLFFSATMPKEIGALAAELLNDPVKVAVTPVASTVDQIEQQVLFVETARKRDLLAELLRDPASGRTLVFSRTKHGADKVVRHLEAVGIAAAAIHGNKSQSQREKALSAFKSGQMKVLIATDIAARGIDVEAVTHVINYDLPNVPESYVHRIGRTARAGASGIAISFCDGEERGFLRSIERLIQRRLPATDRRLAPGSAMPVEAPMPARRDDRRPAQRPPQQRPHGHGTRPPRPQGEPRAQGAAGQPARAEQKKQGPAGAAHRQDRDNRRPPHQHRAKGAAAGHSGARRHP